MEHKELSKQQGTIGYLIAKNRDKIADTDIYMPQIASEDTATWWHILKERKHLKKHFNLFMTICSAEMDME